MTEIVYSPPTDPAIGTICMDVSENKWMMFDGDKWMEIVAEPSIADSWIAAPSATTTTMIPMASTICGLATDQSTKDIIDGAVIKEVPRVKFGESGHRDLDI